LTLPLACLGLALAGCELDEPLLRAGRAEPEPTGEFDAGVVTGRWRQIPPDPNPAVEMAPPQDLGSTQCPGVRMLRVERRHTGAPAAAPPLMPRFYGRDERGEIWSLHDVLACELRAQRWVELAHAEGSNLILWRGPSIFEPDSDCDWREPVRTEAIPGGRRIRLRERCRRRARGGPAERTVVVEVKDDYSALSAR
jgi:hypothetical protein